MSHVVGRPGGGHLAGLAAVALTVLTSTGAQGASDAEIKLLREQLRLMEQRLKELEAKQSQTEEKAEETRRVVDEETVKAGGSLGTFVLPGTDTRISISGYVKGDFIYDTNEALGDVFDPTAISTDGANDENRFRAHARQTRLVIRSTTPSDFGPVKTLFEGDFFGVGGNEVISNSASFRIRHAYGEVGNLGGGQFWTAFMPLQAYPATVDFQGPAGIPFIRQAQLRWTQPVTENLTIIGSLENSEFTGRADADGVAATPDFVSFGDSVGVLGGINAGIDVLPDIVAAAEYEGDFGLIRGSGVLRRFGDQGSGGEWGWGINGGTNLNLWSGANLLGSVTYGDGVGRYIIDGFNQDGVILANGEISTIEALGVTAQLQQKVTDEITLAAAYGRTEIFDTFIGSDFEHVQTVHGTVFWSPVDRVTFGGELIWGEREDASGASDDNFRIQGSVQVNF